MSKCGTCRYTGVKGLIADKELDKGILELLCSPQLLAEVVKYYGHDFPNYQFAILYGGPGELLPYSRIIDLSNINKNYSPFETPDGRIITNFSFCYGTINDSLDNISDPKMQTMVAIGKLIDIAKEKENKDGRIVMLTHEKYKGCCPFHEGVLKFDLAATLEYLIGGKVYEK